MMKFTKSRIAKAVVLALAVAPFAYACNIPVFRYALERWRPDQCEVIVFYKGAMDVEQDALVDQLSPGGETDVSRPIVVQRSNLDQDSAPHRDLWEAVNSENDASLPYVLVRTELARGRVVNGWHGPLNSASLSSLLASPARTELSRRLLTGHSIVWLIIGSSDAAKNDSARKLLQSQCELLAKTVSLPEGIGLPGSELHSEIPLLLKFSVLEINRDDPKENFLVHLFRGFQPDAFSADQPLVVPVFGRGRALEVIPANDLNVPLMNDLTAFLSGACSCQVKEQNPGFDLLLSVDWDTELFGDGVVPPKVRTQRDRKRAELLTIPSGK